MDTLDYDYNIHIKPNAGDDSLLVKFFIDAVKNEAESLKAGRPIFKDVEWIDIRIPGNRDNVVIRPIRVGDIERFPKHYAAFKARVGEQAAEVGTPLSAWPWSGMSRARIEEMKFFNVRTVEQVAALADSIGHKIMGFQAMKTAARGYLENAKATAPLLQLNAQLDKALLKIEEQGNELARMSAQLRGLPSPPPINAAAALRAESQAIMTYDEPAPAKKRKPGRRKKA